MVWATADNVGQVIAPSPRITGSVLYAGVGTPLPTSSYATVNSTFEDLGYIDENGLKQKEDRSQTDVFVWGGDLVASLQQKYSRTMTFKALQFLNENVLAAGFGNSNVSVTPATGSNGKEIAVAMNSKRLDVLSWVFDGYYLTAAGFNSLIRVVIPIGQIVQNPEFDLTNKALTSVDLTIKALPDSAGNHGYLYVNDGITTGAHTGGS